MDKILIVFCSILSCSIINEILFQFMENKYKKNFKKMYLYILARIMIVFSITFINFFHISILNLGCWCFITGISVYFLYYEETEKPLHRILECETLLFCMSICEALGAILLQWFLQGKGMNEINSVMLPCFEIIYDPDATTWNEVYYYPILYKNEIVLVASIINTTNGWTLSASDEIIDGLKKINYKDNSSLFYELDDCILAVSNEETKVIQSDEKEKSLNYNKKEKKFEEISSIEKASEILENIDNMKPVDIKQIQFSTQNNKIGRAHV